MAQDAGERGKLFLDGLFNLQSAGTRGGPACRPLKSEALEAGTGNDGHNSRPPQKQASPLESCDVRAAAYKKLIEKYADYIGQQEEKTIPQLKELVNGDDATVRKTAEGMKQTLEEKRRGEESADVRETSELKYDFPRDFIELAEKAFEMIQRLKPIRADLSVSFWLSPREVLELGAADPFDKAIFLCSLCHALGEKSAKIRVVELEGGAKHPLVLFEHGGKKFVLDASDEGCRFGSARTPYEQGELTGKIACSGKKIVRQMYEFNDREYLQFTDSG